MRTLITAWRRFAGQLEPELAPGDVVAGYALARRVRDNEPALRDASLWEVLKALVAEDQMRAAVASYRPDLTRQRMAQMVNSWAGEAWTGMLPAGEKYWLQNSLDHRQLVQQSEAAVAHRVAGRHGGRPKS